MPAEMRDKERARLTKEQEKLVQQEQATRARLANPDFAAKAPLELVEMAKKLGKFTTKSGQDLF